MRYLSYFCDVESVCEGRHENSCRHIRDGVYSDTVWVHNRDMIEDMVQLVQYSITCTLFPKLTHIPYDELSRGYGSTRLVCVFLKDDTHVINLV